MDKIPPIDIHHLVQAVYGDNCVAVNTVRCGVQQFKQEAVGEATMCDQARSEARMDFKNLWNVIKKKKGKSVPLQAWSCPEVSR